MGPHKDCVAGSMGGKEEAGEVAKVSRHQHRGAEILLDDRKLWRDECRITT